MIDHSVCLDVVVGEFLDSKYIGKTSRDHHYSEPREKKKDLVRNVGRPFKIAQYSPYYVTVLYTQNGRCLPGLFILNKTHQAVESPSHVHRSSVN